MKTLLGTKEKMTQLFKDGVAYGVTPIRFGEDVDMADFTEVDAVRVSGVSKGRGFAGVVKRHNFAGGPKTHGQKHSHRAPGSIGNQAPQRVLPGRKMAGHMGMVRKTMKNISLVSVDAKEKVIFINGSAPGVVGRKVEVVLSE